LHQNNPTNAPLHPWEFPEKPWWRLHIDFAGPFKSFMCLLFVDAHLEWPEVIKFSVGATETRQVISSLSQLPVRFGILNQIVPDNDPQFVAEQFKEHCRQQGILHSLSPPYYPKSNGQVERFIQ
jgi:hypothetical protein